VRYSTSQVVYEPIRKNQRQHPATAFSFSIAFSLERIRNSDKALPRDCVTARTTGYTLSVRFLTCITDDLSGREGELTLQGRAVIFCSCAFVFAVCHQKPPETQLAQLLHRATEGVQEMRQATDHWHGRLHARPGPAQGWAVNDDSEWATWHDFLDNQSVTEDIRPSLDS
jgi:hypothetical protein